MPEFSRQKMCAECPFRANALKGWLGPWVIEDFELMIHTDFDLICHVDISKMQERGLSTDEIQQTGQHCVGMLRYMNSVCKLSRNGVKAAAQQAVEEIPDQPVISAWEFSKYHGSNNEDRKGDADGA
jgi:hypothetical protein